MNKVPFKLVLNYFLEAKTIYSAHSPFIYQFMKEVMNTKIDNDDFIDIEKKRSELINSNDSIEFIDFGAGTSIGNNSNVRKISDVAKNSLSGSWQCRIMYNIVNHFNLQNILEIGTSLGVSTAYLAKANPAANITTLEGNPSSCDIALKLWKGLDIKNVEVKVGEFCNTLESEAKGLGTIDLAFLDGNHKKQATVDYYNILKSYASTKSIFVVDDIYWSYGMNEAWNEIIRDESVAFTIDLFRMGLIFFDHSIMDKQHFKLIPYKFKPWAIGLFG